MNVLTRFPLRAVPELKRTPEDFAPKARACERPDGICQYTVDCDKRDKCIDMSLTFETETRPVGDTTTFPIDLPKFAAELSRNRLAEIAAAMRALTYGEMMELAAGLWDSNEQQPLTEDMLPVVLHRWSKGQERK